MEQEAKVYVAGHRGLVGAAILRRLEAEGYRNLLFRTYEELDLREPGNVSRLFATEKPDYVFVAAAKVGGIQANNTYPADFIRDNLLIELNLIDSAWRSGVRRLLFLGSSCIYPRLASQPMLEEALLTGTLEPTNEPYAIAKIAGIKLCESYNRQFGTDFRSLMPTNLYGPGDNFDLANSHVIPALLRKFHQAKRSGAPWVEVWGTGQPRREFLHVEDLADACLFVMKRPQAVYAAHTQPMLSHLNVGAGEDISISDLAALVAEVVGYRGEIRFDPTKPDGTPRKLLDSSRLRGLGWRPRIGLRQGLQDTYRWFGRVLGEALEA